MKVGIAFGSAHALNGAADTNLPLEFMPMKE
jgi:hypothetical protein